METVNPDTLVKTVGANVPTLITARNVKVDVTVTKTAVTFRLGVQMSVKVVFARIIFLKMHVVFSNFKQSLFNMKHRTYDLIDNCFINTMIHSAITYVDNVIFNRFTITLS